jgi:hypothetical protein
MSLRLRGAARRRVERREEPCEIGIARGRGLGLVVIAGGECGERELDA